MSKQSITTFQKCSVPIWESKKKDTNFKSTSGLGFGN
jgi:hypothetical protein